MKFQINGTPQESRYGAYPPKPSYGSAAVLVRQQNGPVIFPTSPENVPVICAVDSKGRFFTEEGSKYTVCSFTGTFVDMRAAEEKLAYRRQQRAHRMSVRRSGADSEPVRYYNYLGLFLQSFRNVSARDASREWYSMDEDFRIGKTKTQMVMHVIKTRGYQLNKSGKAAFRIRAKRREARQSRAGQ